MNPPNPVGRPVTKKREEKLEFLTMDVGSSDSIGDACRRAVKIADAKHTPVRFVFQGVPLEAKEDDDPWTVANFWFKNRPKP